MMVESVEIWPHRMVHYHVHTFADPLFNPLYTFCTRLLSFFLLKFAICSHVARSDFKLFSA